MPRIGFWSRKPTDHLGQAVTDHRRSISGGQLNEVANVETAIAVDYRLTRQTHLPELEAWPPSPSEVPCAWAMWIEASRD